MVTQGSRRRAVAVVLAAAVTVLFGAAGANAALVPIGPGGSSTTSTTSTTAPSRTTATTGNAQAPNSGGDSAPTVDSVPAAISARVASVRRTAPNSTDALVAGLAPLGQYGLTPTQQALVGFGRFPVAGPTHWSDDWWNPRHDDDGTWRVHEGLDMFAPLGTPVMAPVDGTVEVSNGGLGGLAITVHQPDGTYWYLCHLSAIAQGMAAGVTVKTGQVVGFVGNSGDAAGGPTHVHLEIHPHGGAAVPPKPVVDRFIADDLARLPSLLDTYAKAYDNGAPQPAAAVPAPAPAPLTTRDALLWMSAANPAGGTLRLAEAAAEDAASRIDWSTRH